MSSPGRNCAAESGPTRVSATSTKQSILRSRSSACALGDSAENPRYIENLPKRGYRFIAEVTVVDTDVPTKSPESADEIGVEQSLSINFKTRS